MSATKTVGAVVTYAAVLARAAAYGIRAANTKRAVERLKSRFDDRGASAKYLSEAMTVLEVDEPTTTAYMEVSTLSEAMSANVGSIVSASDTLSTVAQGLAEETTGQHGRMADANKTHHVPMASRQFIKPQ
ncbi:hypothetical protein PV332_14865 [Streptomyces scabiei]|uniref:hypothetical protein n=1 Tax=Streptomyces TaxID=1883 RepID=UPI00073AD969|nr:MULTISPECIES: hypothetical protein [Streptomyces]ALV39296.1 hypothetical protein AS200_45240 [Streptomyces sp. CdTB01]MBK3646439.1 hypothetical protein [Streptomyces sp. MBT33]MDX2576753.1 hypothetical protein [Streptomyces scabiei]MDX3027135.1 hypothetical protein [Streptomyces scabiei]MDX3204874.1 hypothetical protein [Streptomyces scabiei]